MEVTGHTECHSCTQDLITFTNSNCTVQIHLEITQDGKPMPPVPSSLMRIGVNSMNAIGLLKQDYKEESTLEEGLLLCVKVLLKTMDTASPSAEKCKIQILN